MFGASTFWRGVAGMRDARDREPDLHARSGESARAFVGTGSLSPKPFWAETGEREPGGRLTETETRFTAGEKIQTPLHRGARRGDARRCSPISVAAVNRDGRARLERSLTVLTFSLDPMMNSERWGLSIRPATPTNRSQSTRTRVEGRERVWRYRFGPSPHFSASHRRAGPCSGRPTS